MLDVLRLKMGYPELKQAVRDQAQRHGATVVLVEDKASGTQLIQELTRDGLRVIRPVTPTGDKVMRFNAQTATIAGGFVFVPQQAP